MIAYLVSINIKPESVNAFKAASIINAQNSLNEPGIERFDLIQRADDPTKFMLIEIYRSEEDTVKHKQTKHYNDWRETVADMMAEPRVGVRYDIINPEMDS
ncbi:MAG: putative quinol monooxygenase [Anaerolineales bacterium]|jgi:quinol monooxygenase YgiN